MSVIVQMICGRHQDDKVVKGRGQDSVVISPIGRVEQQFIKVIPE